MTTVALSKTDEPAAGKTAPSEWVLHMRYVLAAWAGILLLFWQDVWSMVMTWWDVSTYNHCLLILPIIYWLVHQRSAELIKITPKIWSPGLLWIGIASVGWMLGEAAGVSFAKHLGIIMMLQGVVVTFLGASVARGLIFPIAYGFFLVPFGEELVPFLQTLTAKMSMILLGWANIPAFIDGIFISTPTGYFEVAEACSGIKFLIAMVAYGALVCNVCFQSWNRRALFMVASIIVPIIANGIRAFGTIYIAHHTSIDFASGFDHIFYGWFFFAFVLALVMLIGWLFFDRKIDDQMIDGKKHEPMETLSIDVPEEAASKAINLVSLRKGDLLIMEPKGDLQHLEFTIPSRGLIGLRNRILTATAGTAIINHRFSEYGPYKGDFTEDVKGAIISSAAGKATAYALNRLQDRGRFFIDINQEIYIGQVIGENSKDTDLAVNLIKGKQLTNMRKSGTDDAMKIAPKVDFSLEENMEYIKVDEYLEVTPESLRMRKIVFKG